VTASIDENLHGKVVQLKHGLQIAGFGGSAYSGLFTDTEIGTNLTNLYSQMNTTWSTILMTYGGPAGFSTTLKKSASLSIDQPVLSGVANSTDTGTQSLTNLLVGQSTTILNVHGNNPTGIGEASFGYTKIINPGSARYTNSLVLAEFIINPQGSWVLNNWKFYRYGNVTVGSAPQYATTIHDTCAITHTTVSSPYVTDLYAKISIGFYTGFTVIVIALVVFWVFTSGKFFSDEA